MVYIAILSAMFAGNSIVISRMMNATLAIHTDTYQSTFYNFLMGLASSLILFWASLIFSNPYTVSFQTVPWWALSGGALGLIVVSISNIITPKISAFLLTLLIFTGQIITGLGIDYFLSNSISYGNFLGTLIVLFGLYTHLKLS